VYYSLKKGGALNPSRSPELLTRPRATVEANGSPKRKRENEDDGIEAGESPDVQDNTTPHQTSPKSRRGKPYYWQPKVDSPILHPPPPRELSRWLRKLVLLLKRNGKLRWAY